MAAVALSRPNTLALPPTKACVDRGIQAEMLCDQLLGHMLECELCLDPEQPTCAVCVSLQGEISALGGPANGAIFAV
jgi:hypothetical protein